MNTREIAIRSGDVELRCQLGGVVDAEAPLVIAAHGFPDGPRSFREQLPALAGAGYRVVIPCMRGYAPSGAGRCRGRELGADLLAIADELSPAAPVRLVGHDWGALACYAAAALEPTRFSHLLAMAVPHLRSAGKRWLAPAQLRRSWYMGLFQLPRVAEALLVRDDLALLDRLWRAWSPGYRCPAEEMRHIKDGIRPRVPEVLRYYRDIPRSGAAGRLLMSRCAVPAMYLHGEDDGCVGVEVSEGLEEAFVCGVERHVLRDAGHFVHLEQPQRVNELMLRFFS